MIGAVPSDPPRRFVTIPGGRAAYTDEGAGAVVIAVHGLPGSARDFRWLAPPLGAGARVVRVDLPGFGETPVACGPDPSPEGRARFVIEVADALGLQAPTLLGHSMGGVVGCAAVALAPGRFARLALISSPGVRAHAMFARTPFTAFAALLRPRPLRFLLRPLTRAMFASAGFRGVSDAALARTVQCAAATSMPRHAAHVRALTLPTLVAWCDDDPLIEAGIAAELAASCPDGPRLCWPTGGHNPQKAHAAELARVLLAWMGEERAAQRA